MFSHFDFRDEPVGDFLEMARGSVLWLGKKIHGAERQGFQCGVAALFRVRAEKNDGQRRAAHDEAEHFEAVHARHLEVERDDIGFEFLNLSEREGAVHSGTNDLDRKSTRLNSSHGYISYAVFCLKKKTNSTNHVDGSISSRRDSGKHIGSARTANCTR